MVQKCKLNRHKVAKSSNGFICSYCDYSTSRKNNYEKHLATLKHLKNCKQNVTFCKENYYICTECNKKYKSRKGLWSHKKKYSGATKCYQSSTEVTTEVTKSYFCEICDKKYKSRMGLWLHKKKCKKPLLEDKIDLSGEKMLIDKNEYIKLLKTAAHNQKINIGTQNNNNTNIKTQNNNISINVFLNEHCKNAICLEDFITNINATIKDLINTKQDGHVKGISNIITKGLLDMPSTDRPIHSTDIKRNKFVVKKEEGWEKDDGTEVGEAIQNVKFKLVGPVLTEWEEQHPDFKNNSEELDEWQKMLAVTVPSDKEKATKAIKKNIAQAVPIKDAINEIKE